MAPNDKYSAFMDENFLVVMYQRIGSDSQRTLRQSQATDDEIDKRSLNDNKGNVKEGHNPVYVEMSIRETAYI